MDDAAIVYRPLSGWRRWRRWARRTPPLTGTSAPSPVQWLSPSDRPKPTA